MDTLSNKVSSVEQGGRCACLGEKSGLNARDKEARLIISVERLQRVLGLVDGEYGGSGKGRKEGTGDEGTLITDYLICWSLEGHIKRALGLDR